MKRVIFLMALLFTVFLSCNKKLIEEPRSTLVPDALNTAQGVQMALDAAYAGTRLFWGNQDFYTVTVIGTDEYQRGVDGNNDINVYNSSYTAAHGTVNANWRNAYTFINTANAVIDNTPAVDLPEATKSRMIGEAKFLRANFYYILVQFFGDITLNKNFHFFRIAGKDYNQSLSIIFHSLNQSGYGFFAKIVLIFFNKGICFINK